MALNKEERRKYAKALGKQGGKKRAQTMTPEERSQAARAAVTARWKAYRAAKGEKQ